MTRHPAAVVVPGGGGEPRRESIDLRQGFPSLGTEVGSWGVKDASMGREFEDNEAENGYVEQRKLISKRSVIPYFLWLVPTL